MSLDEITKAQELLLGSKPAGNKREYFRPIFNGFLHEVDGKVVFSPWVAVGGKDD